MAAEVLRLLPPSYAQPELAVTLFEPEEITEYSLTVQLIVRDKLAAARDNRSEDDTTFGRFMQQAGFDRKTGNIGRNTFITSYTAAGDLIHVRSTDQVELNPQNRFSGRMSDQLTPYFQIIHASLETGAITNQVVPATHQYVYGQSVWQLGSVDGSHPYGLEALPLSDNPLQAAIDQRRQQLAIRRHQEQQPTVILSPQGCDFIVNGMHETLEPLSNRNGIWRKIAALEQLMADDQ